MDAELDGIFKRLLAILHSYILATAAISTLDHHTDEDLSIKLAIPLGPIVLCDQNN